MRFARKYVSEIRQRTVVDAVNRGGWTQIFGGKAFEPETSRQVKNAILPTLPAFGACIWRPRSIGIS